MTELSHKQWLNINEILLKLYASKDLEELRSKTLHDLETIIPHKKSWFDLGVSKDNRIDFFNPVSHNMTEKELEDYYEVYQASDYIPWSFLSDAPLVYRDSDILDNELREKTYFFKNYLEPMGVYYGMGCTLVEKHVFFGSITLFRSKEEKDFSDEELLMLDILSKHISSLIFNWYPNGFRNSVPVDESHLLMTEYDITPREYEVLGLASQGMTNAEISERLFISKNTVKKHINSLFRKLNVNTRSQMINFFYQHRNQE
jgi:DNA-binding CsgD family transcriptional regulator